MLRIIICSAASTSDGSCRPVVPNARRNGLSFLRATIAEFAPLRLLSGSRPVPRWLCPIPPSLWRPLPLPLPPLRPFPLLSLWVAVVAVALIANSVALLTCLATDSDVEVTHGRPSNAALISFRRVAIDSRLKPS